MRPDRPGVMSAVAWINHDAADFQSQRARQRTLAVAVGFGSVRRRRQRGRLAVVRFRFRSRLFRGGSRCSGRDFRGRSRFAFRVHRDCRARHRARFRINIAGIRLRILCRCAGRSGSRRRRAGDFASGSRDWLRMNIDHKPVGIRQQISANNSRAPFTSSTSRTTVGLFCPRRNGLQQPLLNIRRFFLAMSGSVCA